MPDWLFRSLQAITNLAATLTWAAIGLLTLCLAAQLMARWVRWVWRKWLAK